MASSEWKESLKTKDLEEAKRRLRQRVVEIDLEIAAARLRAGSQASAPITLPEAQKLAQNALAGWLAADEADRVERGADAADDIDTWLEAREEDEREALATGNWRLVERQALDALEAQGRWYGADDPSLRLVAVEMLKARVRFIDLVRERQRGVVVDTPLAQSLILTAPAPMSSGMTLGELVDRYRAERERDHGEESTSRKYSHIFRALEEALGRDRPIVAITRADCKAVQEEVEEEIAQGRTRLRDRIGATSRELRQTRRDVLIGMLFSNAIMYFIILSTGSTLHPAGQHQIDTAAQAAEALRPLAGDFASGLFILGIVGVGFLAVPVMTTGAAYDIAQALGWRHGLALKAREAKRFYATIGVITALAVGLNFLGLNPMRVLVISGIVQGFSTPPLLLLIMLLTNDRRVMGERVNGLGANILGWTTTAAVFSASAALLASWLLSRR